MSNAITFDTLDSVKRLKAAGFSDEQAETQTRIIAELVDDRLATKQDLTTLATKEDITSVRSDIAALDKQLLVIKWMLALVIVVTVVPVLKTLF